MTPLVTRREPEEALRPVEDGDRAVRALRQFGSPLGDLVGASRRPAEPVIVDTGTVANRGQWLDDVFGLVDPADVRYVFISHDDVDHTGNLAEVMERCPKATLLASWALVERFSNAFAFPLLRCRWVDDGSHLDLDDRRLHFVRPPLWDSPTTRGVFDTSTEVDWAVDAFATPCSTAVEASVDELDPEAWRARHGDVRPPCAVAVARRWSTTAATAYASRDVGHNMSIDAVSLRDESGEHAEAETAWARDSLKPFNPIVPACT